MTKEIKAKILAVKEFPYSKLIDLEITDKLREAVIIGYNARDEEADSEMIAFAEWKDEQRFSVWKGQYYDNEGHSQGDVSELLELFKSRREV